MQKEITEKNEISHTFEHRLNEAHIEVHDIVKYSGTSLVRSPPNTVNLVQSQIVLYNAKNMTFSSDNTVTSPSRSFLPSPMGDLNSEVPL